MLARAVALLGALAVVAAVVATLAAPSAPIVSTTGARPIAFVAEARGGDRICVPGVSVPARATAARVTLATFGRSGESVVATVGDRRATPLRDVAEGVVDVPLPAARPPAPLCFSLLSSARFAIAGEPGETREAAPGVPVAGYVSLEFLDDDPPPWSALAGVIADRVGYGKGALGGRGTAWAIGASALLGVAGTFLLAWAAFGRRPPSARRAAAAVAAVTAALGVTWALLIPPFQMADETAHFAYVQHVAETGEVPGGPPERGEFSSDLSSTLDAIGFNRIVGRPLVKAPGDRATDAAIERTLEAERAQDDGGGPSTASGQPALYYWLAAAGYHLLGGELLGGLYGARLVSVLLFALTSALVALLAAEVLPRVRWAPAVAGLVAALVPQMGFVASSANPDALLFAAGAATLLTGARLVRHGVSRRRALAFGAAVGVGLAAKLTYLGLVPGAVVAALLALRRPVRLPAVRQLALAALVAALPVGAYAAWATATGDGPFQLGTRVTSLPADQVPAGSLREMLSYGWQLFLPRLPFLQDEHVGFPPAGIWLDGLVGRFGWLDYGVAPWIYGIARDAALVALALLVVWLVRHRSRAVARWREIAFFAVAAAGLAAVITKAGYDYRRSTGLQFEQARYLLPLLGLLALGGIGACLAVGRRFAPALAAVLVSLLALGQLAGWLATISRYYA